MFRLALALGYPHPRYLRRYLTSRDVADWRAFDRVEPFGGRNEELMHGLLCATVANTFSTNSVDPYRFMPHIDGPVMSPGQILANIREHKERASGSNPEP